MSRPRLSVPSQCLALQGAQGSPAIAVSAAVGGLRLGLVAAVLLFRVLTYGIQIPLGGFTYVIWRLKKSWRREAPKVELDSEPETQPV